MRIELEFILNAKGIRKGGVIVKGKISYIEEALKRNKTLGGGHKKSPFYYGLLWQNLKNIFYTDVTISHHTS